MVVDLMDFSNSGALMQAFILTAVQQYAEQCIEAGATAFDTGYLNGHAWIACATEANAEISAHLKLNR
ncbi:hypothetical protein [Chitinimonas koreensis]|uniref:hypothetical protein n=1 Tax=Chitinimonas koreensis TaxID=356302 RepID=UPI00054EA7D9|nr:hypothetical protein [Chitinimonas koreensis]QNM95494.1 hypothetical protein H9L41_16705 [Chitinimonas koreensis]